MAMVTFDLPWSLGVCCLLSSIHATEVGAARQELRDANAKRAELERSNQEDKEQIMKLELENKHALENVGRASSSHPDLIRAPMGCMGYIYAPGIPYIANDETRARKQTRAGERRPG